MTINKVTGLSRYISYNSGSSWTSRGEGVTAYLKSKSYGTWSCYTFSYTPTSETRISEIEFSCQIMVSNSSGANHQFLLELYNQELPSSSETPIASVTLDVYRWKDDDSTTVVTFEIPDDIVISEQTDFSVVITAPWYSSSTNNPYLGWNASAYANITEQSIYTITYDANGHGTAPSAATVYEGNSITLPTMAAEGYIFLGWSEDSTATNGVTGTYTPTNSVTLYAIWRKDETVIYFDNIPAFAFEDLGDTVLIQEAELPSPAEAVGKTFMGWYNMNNVLAEVGNPWNSLSIGGELDIYLYSKWSYHTVITDGRKLANIADGVRKLNRQSSTETYLLKEIPSAIIKTPFVNFEVIGGTTEPENPKENLIWINTDTEITSWHFGTTAPASYAEGTVWISTNPTGAVSFNAFTKGQSPIYPASAKQYINGAWVNKKGKNYQDGEWKEWIIILSNGIDECVDVTGGWQSLAVNICTTGTSTKALNVTYGTDYIELKQPSGGYAGIYVTKNKVSCTNRTALKIMGQINAFNQRIVVALMSDLTSSGVVTKWTAPSSSAAVLYEFNDEAILDLPNGDYYIAFGIYSTDSQYIKLNKVYLE